MDRKKLAERAKKISKRLARLRKDSRYLKTIGKLKKAGFLDVRGIPEASGQVFLDDAIWAGSIEPRIFELIPAIIVKHPKFFAYQFLPEDLAIVVTEIKRG
ncbi:hypothetical protein, partial [Streptococcus pseudopneumoniae]|uniref:hypothetical protein n=1 Tax=Streptococcus pseudopneumoniae TaxID=257758 RepID=UPI00110C3921